MAIRVHAAPRAKPRAFSPLTKLFIIASVFGGIGVGYVAFTATGSALLNLTLFTQPALERGLIGHWTFDGRDATPGGPGDWYDAAYQYRRAITINSGKVATTTSGFAIVATTTLSDLRHTSHGGKVQHASGHDIIWVDSDNTTLLAFEYEKYASTTGEIVHWINTDISSTTDKTIYMYYGKSGAGDLSDPANVWPSYYAGVWNFSQTPLSGTGNNEMLDSSGTGNHGDAREEGGTIDQVSGQVDGALEFDGVESFVRVSNHASLQITGPITLMAWVKPNTTSGGREFLSKKCDTTEHGYRLRSLGSSLRFEFGSTGNNANRSTSASNVITVGEWQYVAAIYDMSTAKTYRNAVEVSSADHTAAIATGSTVLTIGQYPCDAYYFDGSIDDVRIVDGALTPADLTTIYNNTADNASFLTIGGEEPFAPGEGVAADRSGQGNHGEIIGAQVVPGRIGQALQFDGVDGQVTTSFTQQLGDFTACAWFKTSSDIASRRIIDKNYASGFWMGHETTGAANQWGGGVAEADSPFGTFVTLPNGSWHHLCSVRSGTTHTIYGDGGAVSASNTVTSAALSADTLIIGNDQTTSQPFDGLIDDVRIYNRALSADEIKRLYQLGGTTKVNVTLPSQPATEQGLVAHFTFDGRDTTPVGMIPVSLQGSPTVRYFLDEAASGQAPTEILDAAASPLAVPLVYADSNPNYAAPATGRSLSWDAILVRGRAELSNVDGTKIKNDIHGSTRVTVEFVIDPVDARENDSRVFQIGDPAGGSTRLLNVQIGTTDQQVNFRWKPSGGSAGTTAGVWNSAWTANERAVYHLVLDTTLATAGNRVRLYKNGQLVTKSSGTDPTQNSTIDLETDRVFAIGNRVGPPDTASSRAIEGEMGYFAMYAEALTAAQIEENATMLLAGDDPAEEASEGFAADRSGQGNHGEIIGAQVAPGRIGQALSFGGSSAGGGTISMSRVQSADSGTGDGSRTATFSATPTQGNLLVVISSHRGDGETPTISGSGWNLAINRCYGVASGNCGTPDSTHRRGLALWWKVAGASEATGITVSWDDNEWHKVIAQEFSAGTDVTWTFEDKADNDTGTSGATSPLSSGTTGSVPAGDLLVVAAAGWRAQGTDNPGSISWTNGIGDLLNSPSEGNNLVAVSTGFDHQTSGGTKESTVSWTGSGHEAMAGILVFSAAQPPEAAESFVEIGDLGSGVQSIAFWLRTSSTTQSILELSGSASIGISGGTITTSGITSPTIYVDGAVSSAVTANQWHHVAITTGTGITASSVNIGRVGSNYYSGLLDDVRFYSKALSADDVKRLHALGGTARINTTHTPPRLAAGLAGHWTFDGKDMNWPNTGSEVRDRSGQGNHGALEGGMSQSSARPGRLGQALSFNGTSDFIDIGETGAGVRTVSFWMRAASATEAILELSGSASIEASGGTIATSGFTSPTIYVDGAVSSSVRANTWHHVAVVTESPVSADAVRLGRIGASHFAGLLDDVRLYDRALPAGEGKELYNLGR